jgi:hypothetical protein
MANAMRGGQWLHRRTVGADLVVKQIQGKWHRANSMAAPKRTIRQD